MNYNIFSTHRFEKELKQLSKKYSSLKKEFSDLLNNLNKNPKMGILLGNDCYKIRLAISSKGKGKSGGARIITYLYIDTKSIYLLSIYDKSEKENLKSKDLKKMVENLDVN